MKELSKKEIDNISGGGVLRQATGFILVVDSVFFAINWLAGITYLNKYATWDFNAAYFVASFIGAPYITLKSLGHLKAPKVSASNPFARIIAGFSSAFSSPPEMNNLKNKK